MRPAILFEVSSQAIVQKLCVSVLRGGCRYVHIKEAKAQANGSEADTTKAIDTTKKKKKKMPSGMKSNVKEKGKTSQTISFCPLGGLDIAGLVTFDGANSQPSRCQADSPSIQTASTKTRYYRSI